MLSNHKLTDCKMKGTEIKHNEILQPTDFKISKILVRGSGQVLSTKKLAINTKSSGK